ncbi:uncharacterized protein LOC122649931 [Telopea speciosissima]|uniref:uncharacterized protein LOC122649931 n=1 Tax=Telopea speciosissima TaxID=54955 RepID=UPI001CC73383|nr:uncharacterized protein LOC122649931 [Telopea speciosissima]XP_043699131.1 uncharacterized protein LOC122649931 [Telopea speciosissima]
MSNMDSKRKGITWVGNLYQKFEAMCLEVEDIVCQETTKYVENQVQSVGVSVKKFYSELMEDFLPPSYEDLEKPKEGIDENLIEESPPVKKLEKVAPDGKNLSRGSSFRVFPNISHLPPSSEDPEKPKECIGENPIEESPLVKELEKVAPAGENLSRGSSFRVFPNISHLPPCSEDPEKPKEGIRENPMDESPPVKELEKVSPNGKNLSRGSSFRVFQNISHLPPSFEDPIKGTGSDLTIELGVEEFTVEDKLSSPKVLKVIAPSGNDFSGASLLTGLHNENNDRTCNMTTTVSTLNSVDVAQCNSTQGAGKICNELFDATVCISDDSSASSASLVLPASFLKNEAGIGLTPSGSIPLIEFKDNSKTLKTISSMCGNGRKQYNDCAELDAILPLPDNGTSDGYNVEEMAEGNGAARSDEETIDACHRVKLDESCVLVDINELHLASQRTVKNRSYKKKLRDAFASRMRSGKKQEYERLALLCGDIDTGTNNEKAGSSQISTLAEGLESKKLPIHDCCDSEWEIL